MASFGQVYVKKNKYRIRGDFHHLTPNIPIYNADDQWRLIGVTNPREMTYIHTYGGEATFFDALSQGRLLASRCSNQECEYYSTTYQPFRIFCPDCLVRNEVIDMTDIAKTTAKIYTYMVCERSGAFNNLERPIKFINIQFNEIDTILMSYLSFGDPSIGMKVVPIFRKLNPTHTILDLSWVPSGTHKTDLPEGFGF